MIRSRFRLLPIPLLAASLLAACDEPTTAPPGLVVEAVEGNAQVALPGDSLPGPIGVRVSRDGLPVAGVAVTFRADEGSGTVAATSAVTDGFGMARTWWRLPAQGSGAFAVTAEAEGGAQPARFTAGWLPRDRADLLLANVSTPIRLLLHPPAQMGSPLAFRATFTDSMIITPFAAVADYAEAVAFTPGRPPLLLRNLRWTPGRDTLRLEFPRLVEVPLTIWVVRRPYETTRASVEAQLQAAREVWGKAGIRFSDVRWVDATAHPEADLMQGPTPACGAGERDVGRDVGRTNVYVTGPPVYAGHTYGGYACTQSFVYVTPIAYATLLAHELGHTFGLGHNAPETLMNHEELGANYNITAGQIFHAHASVFSAIQIHYMDQAVTPAVQCFVPGSCVQQSWDF